MDRLIDKIIEVSKTDNIRLTYAPGDLWNRRQETGKSAMEVFGENGVELFKAGNNRIQGWYSVKEALKVFSSKNKDNLKAKW